MMNVKLFTLRKSQISGFLKLEGEKYIMKVLVLNGPNLNRLGKREPTIYGNETLEQIMNGLDQQAKILEVEIAHKQSNHEGELIDWIHQADDIYDGIILNAGAFTHYSYAVRDAIASISTPTIEVHLSNIYARESFRHTSVLSEVVIGQISGFGTIGYELAVRGLIHFLRGKNR